MAVSKSQTRVGLTIGILGHKDQKEITDFKVYIRDNLGKFKIYSEQKFDIENACVEFCFNNN